MSMSAPTKSESRAVDVSFSDSELIVALADGRKLSVPLEWFPSLLHPSTEERSNWRLIGAGVGMHWESIDEDLSVAGLL